MARYDFETQLAHLIQEKAPALCEGCPADPPVVTMTEHLTAAEMDEEAYVLEQQRMARERILRRALRSTPKGDPKAREY